MLCPQGASPELVAKLNERLRKAVSDPAFQARLDLLGVRAESATPDTTKKFVASEIKRWGEVIDRAGVEKIN